MDGIGCILMGGPEYVIVVSGTEYAFEMHPYLGPCPFNRSTGKERELGPRHKFWTAVTYWAKQGCAVDADGKCAWKERYFFPISEGYYESRNESGETEYFEHLGGRHYRLLNGDPRKKGSADA